MHITTKNNLKVKLTSNELAVLKGIDHSEYGDNLNDSVWSWSIGYNIPDECGEIKAKSIPGIVASLVKKGIVSCCGEGKEASVGMTEKGERVYIAAVGKTNKQSITAVEAREADPETPEQYRTRTFFYGEGKQAPDLTSHDPCHALDSHPKVNIQPRYFNVAAITTDARTVSTQVWTSEPAEADAVLAKWITPDQEKWHGQIALGSIHDSLSSVTRYYRVNRSGVQVLGIEQLV